MHLTTATIEEALRMHAIVRGQTWSIPYHVQCWNRAAAAFENRSVDDFNWLYLELRNRWQALRPNPSAAWTATQTFERLCGLDQGWGVRALSGVRDDDLHACFGIIESMVEIKPMKYTPSVVAISKFLHFRNPRLFVIVDDAIMWRWVFRHRWLWQGVNETRQRIASLMQVNAPIGASCAFCPTSQYSAGVLKFFETIQKSWYVSPNIFVLTLTPPRFRRNLASTKPQRSNGFCLALSSCLLREFSWIPTEADD